MEAVNRDPDEHARQRATSNRVPEEITSNTSDEAKPRPSDVPVLDSAVHNWLTKFQGLQPDSYWLTRVVLLRATAFIYLVAFAIAYHQNKQLIGDRGLLPLRLYLTGVTAKYEGWWQRFSAAPTVLWLAHPWTNVDPWLDAIALVGASVAAIVFLSGAANWPCMMLLWSLYHSLVAVGQRWYGFGWESQLLETGLLMAWFVPLWRTSQMPHPPPSYVAIYGLRWLIFRIMFGAGMIKVRGDSCWRALTCMDYHYETQPVPNPLAYYLHQSPPVVHKLEVVGNHIVELVIPWLVFGNRTCRVICAVVQIFFQVVLIISGNLSFLNWLTIVPSLALLDDRSYQRFFPSTKVRQVAVRQLQAEQDHPKAQPGLFRDALNLVLCAVLAYLSIPVVVNLLSSRQAMNTSFEPFRILNTYGAFGSITKHRHEIILEGLASNDTWLEYEFNCKPGNVMLRPCLISPYHYRLDWLMWFAAMQPAEHNPWLFHLVYKLLANDPAATELMRLNPFDGASPPRMVRALLYQYQYTAAGGGSSGWYERQLVDGSYMQAHTNDSLAAIATRMRWR
ncbi:Lipase maturation factor [Trinorchestia longiramus]|nr:Lipase maturation factor [Trinorchestia longiramus]